ncbi:MAG: hypothetical protein V1742_05810, partial [Pseudomonadota bacterium]
HRGFDDPPELAANAADEAEALGHYRRVRDEIRALVEQMPEILEKSSTDPLAATSQAIGGFLKGLK